MSTNIFVQTLNLTNVYFKLDWHRYNLKRRLQNKPVASEEDFEKMVEKNSESISLDQVRSDKILSPFMFNES